MSEIHELTALEIAAAYAAGETDPVEVVEHFLARIDEHSDTFGAFVTVTADQARSRAREAAAALAENDDDRRTPLTGVPTAFKDLNLTAGVRTTFGSAAMEDFVPKVSDQVVANIESAGLIGLGKTNTPEFGSPCYTEPDVAPPARTPYDLERSAGGSSGGAAAAVSAGLVPLAQGSDGGGSIRIPASVCGLFGLKPSRGRISGAPRYGDITGLSTAGPIAQTVRDAAAMLDVMAGPAASDPLWAERLAPSDTYLARCDHDPGALRIARFATPVIAETEVDPQVLFAYDQLSETLEGLGHTVEDIDAPFSGAVVSVFETIWAVSASMFPVPEERQARLRPLSRWLRERGAKTSGMELANALLRMNQIAAKAIGALAPYDAVLTPTLAQLPALVGGLRDDNDPAADFEAQKAYTPFTSMWNVTGMPAVSVPTAWSTEGLPIGTMLAGRPGAEHVLLALSAQIEAATSVDGRPWNRPPVAP
ncbi:amidase [Solicola gregarius]|uniref:Amidase n=1 Tax=Solicola gregarius TaxID=2908642 RepID=A0AA46TFH1_9ACTN|nr:amidase [Solicola gregarius]UYM04270.1 amidase [Solicola gregarius]